MQLPQKLAHGGQIRANTLQVPPTSTTQSNQPSRYFGQSICVAPNDLGDKIWLSKLKDLYYKYEKYVNSFMGLIPSTNHPDEVTAHEKIRKALLLSEGIPKTHEIYTQYQVWADGQAKKSQSKSLNGRKLSDILGNNVVYYSKRGDNTVNKNCEAVNIYGEKIACRHLAFWFLCHSNDYHELRLALESGERTKLKSLDENIYDICRIAAVSNSSEE